MYILVWKKKKKKSVREIKTESALSCIENQTYIMMYPH